ncbi:MAG: hypothetical protein IK115_10540 [Lachnospiraceae bacterium]|nr:hypothetical protein [Lachnospiraceae bacterium]
MAMNIGFKARSFKLVADCESNAGSRLVVTENGENLECFEIGTGGAATEIEQRLTLEPETDYVFRFAIRSRFVRAEAAESLVTIFFDEPGDGYNYPMDRADSNRFKPALCKNTDSGLLRIFELPFNSGDSRICTIRIVLHDMTAWIYPAKDDAAYAELEDVDYAQWYQDEVHKLAKKLGDLGDTIGGTINEIGGTLGEALNGIGGFVGGVGEKVSKVVSDAIKRPAADAEEKEEEPAEAAAEEAAEEAAESSETFFDGDADKEV